MNFGIHLKKNLMKCEKKIVREQNLLPNQNEAQDARIEPFCHLFVDVIVGLLSVTGELLDTEGMTNSI